MSKEIKNVISTNKTLIGLDVTNMISFKKRNLIVVDSLSERDRINIERIGYEYKQYRIEKNGVSGTAIILN